MSDIIQLLPDNVANQIAAGEVIQRPASIIKELVENAIDARATTINIAVVDAGRTSVQVLDNGSGMTATDALMAFERHATSKIRDAADLFTLQTMGFRGEALASIAAVAQVELRTRREADQLGTSLSIAGSKILSQEPCSCPAGSNFLVENLFFNVPARRKFLKSNSTELNNIITAFERIALVYPNIAFTLHSNNTELYNLKPSGYKQRIVDIFGKRLSQGLLPVNVETTLCNLHGFVGKPDSARKKGALQYFFVNGRYMKHPYFNRAIQVAFERLIPPGEQVPYFIYFEVPAETIDVNIHPTKTEIKFESEQAVWQILMAAVKEAVGRFNDVPAIDFNNEGRPDIPIFNPDTHTSAPKINLNPDYNPFRETPHKRNLDNWETIYPQITAEEPTLFENNEQENSIIEEKSPAHYQYKGKYIMTAVKSGLMIIDQHQAHIRILYEDYMRQIESKKRNTQKLLFPEIIQLPTKTNQFAETILPELNEMGFELTDIGDGSYAVNGTPSGLEGLNIANLLAEMLVSVNEITSNTRTDIDHTLALSLARNAAIPHGQVLGNQEMENIVNSLFACENVNYTPDGQKIISIMSQSDIDSLFDK